LLLHDGQVHPDTHAMHIDNYVIGVSNNVIVNRSTLSNSVSVHMSLASRDMRAGDHG
jgi:hypothetical protein